MPLVIWPVSVVLSQPPAPFLRPECCCVECTLGPSFHAPSSESHCPILLPVIGEGWEPRFCGISATQPFWTETCAVPEGTRLHFPLLHSHAPQSTRVGSSHGDSRP